MCKMNLNVACTAEGLSLHSPTNGIYPSMYQCYCAWHLNDPAQKLSPHVKKTLNINKDGQSRESEWKWQLMDHTTVRNLQRPGFCCLMYRDQCMKYWALSHTSMSKTPNQQWKDVESCWVTTRTIQKRNLFLPKVWWSCPEITPTYHGWMKCQL